MEHPFIGHEQRFLNASELPIDTQVTPAKELRREIETTHAAFLATTQSGI